MACKVFPNRYNLTTLHDNLLQPPIREGPGFQKPKSDYSDFIALITVNSLVIFGTLFWCLHMISPPSLLACLRLLSRPTRGPRSVFCPDASDAHTASVHPKQFTGNPLALQQVHSSQEEFRSNW
jgi:hypothetical protein